MPSNHPGTCLQIKISAKPIKVQYGRQECNQAQDQTMIKPNLRSGLVRKTWLHFGSLYAFLQGMTGQILSCTILVPAHWDKEIVAMDSLCCLLWIERIWVVLTVVLRYNSCFHLNHCIVLFPAWILGTQSSNKVSYSQWASQARPGYELKINSGKFVGI